MSPGIVETLVSAFVGGLIAYLALWAQLRHGAQEKERERQLTLRRDVYLDAVEAIGKSQFFLGSFSREDFDTPKLLEKLEEIPGALSKAQIVTSEPTFEALERFEDFMVSNAVSLLGLRLRRDHLQREIEAQQRKIARLEQNRTNLWEELREVGQQGSWYPQGRALLEGVQKDLTATHLLLQRFAERHVEVIESLGREAAKAALGAQAEAGRVIAQIRRELEIPLKEEWYLGRLEERRKRLQPKIDETYRDVDQILAETDAMEAAANPASAADV